ncbi:MAG: 50S ribosomal protein L9 [Gammaproteobacteria bacterium]|nr:50S ribosomal protein L9 [Gammaproteobacteria bacterium]
MEVILLEKVQKLGDLGDCVSVKPGYARNFLIPQGKALPGTAANMAVFEERRASLEAAAKEASDKADVRSNALKELEIVTIAAKAGVGSKLFGSVGANDIAEALTQAGISVEKSEVRLPEGPLHELGEFDVSIHLAADLNKVIKVRIISDEE